MCIVILGQVYSTALEARPTVPLSEGPYCPTIPQITDTHTRDLDTGAGTDTDTHAKSDTDAETDTQTQMMQTRIQPQSQIQIQMQAQLVTLMQVYITPECCTLLAHTAFQNCSKPTSQWRLKHSAPAKRQTAPSLYCDMLQPSGH